MAEATIKIDGININIRSDVFSVKFMDLVKTIEHFQEKYKQNNVITLAPKVLVPPMIMDLSKKSSPSVYNFERLTEDKINKVSQIIDRSEEPRDSVFYLSDSELMIQIKKYLKICNNAGIEEYYKDLMYRPFNLSGLYSKKYGIKTIRQRKIIRDMLRKCIEFTKSDLFKNKIRS
jgi:hypothetical protein